MMSRPSQLVALLALAGCRWGYEQIGSEDLEPGGFGPLVTQSGIPGGTPADAGSPNAATPDAAPPNATAADARAGDPTTEGSRSDGGTPGGGRDAGSAGSDDAGTLDASAPVRLTYRVDSVGDPSETGRTTLRDAILAANALGSPSTITFEAGLGAITLNATLPVITSNLSIIGETTELDFSSAGANQDCIVVNGGTFVLDSVVVRGCPDSPVLLTGGSNHVVTNSTFHDSGGALTCTSGTNSVTIGPGNSFFGGGDFAVNVNANFTEVRDSTFIDTGGSNNAAIGVFGGGSRSRIVGNLLVRSTNGVLASSIVGLDIWNNTLVNTDSIALNLLRGSELDVRNNVISHAANIGIAGAPEVVDFNLYFANATDCSNCNGGDLGSNSLQVDPNYVDFATENFDLQPNSPAVNAGDVSVLIDRNGVQAGNYNGTGPDIGAFETNF